jgi:hypothetical protein
LTCGFSIIGGAVEETLVLVYSDEEAAERVSAPFVSGGHSVRIVPPSDGDCLEQIVESRPIAVALDLSDEWEIPLALAQAILADGRLARPLLVFVGGSPETIGQCKAALPFGVYVRPEELVWVLKRLGLRI